MLNTKYVGMDIHTETISAAWAVADGFLTLPEVEPIDILAEQMAPPAMVGTSRFRIRMACPFSSHPFFPIHCLML